jgi:hypothetical protein
MEATMPTDLELMRQMFTVMESNLFFGDRLTERQFVSLVNPGQFISDKLDPSNASDAYIIASLADKALAASFLYKPLNNTVSKVYGDVLKAALPHVALTNEQQVLLANSRKQLLAIKPAYDERQKAYNDVDYAYSKAIAGHAADADIVRLRQLRAGALSDWQIYGYKDDFEHLQGVVWGLVALDPSRDWADAKRQMDSFAESSALGSFYQTNLFPTPLDWSSAGWTKTSFSIRDSYSNEYSRSTHFDGGGGIGFGLWSFGGSYSEDQQWRHTDSHSSNLDIELEYLVVDVLRPWMTEGLLEARNWAWKRAGQPNVYLSDGGNLKSNPPIAPQGYLPLLPTNWFVVRNVKVSGQWKQADMNYHASQISAGASFGWGPFSCSGSYRESTSSRTATSHFQGTTLYIDQPQIIGVLGNLLQTTPQPDMSLAWGPDANLGTPHYLTGGTPEEARQVKRDVLRAVLELA